MKNLKFALRLMAKSPRFTIVAIVALGLGIGANTAIFSVVNAVLLRPLPFKDPQGLVIINETYRRDTLETRPACYPDFVDWRDQNRSFEGIAAFDSPSLTLTGDAQPERVPAEIVSASYFTLLGVRPEVGRTFLAGEDRTPDASPVAVVSHKLWQRRFGADASILGKTVKLNDRDFTMVGVMPEGFEGMSGGVDIWIPFAMISTVGSPSQLQDRGSRWHSVIARLKPGVSIDQAQADLGMIAARLEKQYPASNKDRGVQVIAAREAAVGNMRPMLTVLLGAVGFVLLIACANVANLLLARAASREKEIAVRRALGANRRRLVSQLMTESMMLAIAGGCLALLMAVWGIDLLVAFIGSDLPPYIKPGIDAQVLVFTLVVSILTGVIFGLAPALQASKADLNESLKEGSRGSTGGVRRHRMRRVLVVSEVALAMVLLVGAGLMLRSFRRLQAFSPGFDAGSTLTFRLNLPAKYTPEEVAVFQQQVVERLAALPGAQSVGLATDVPLDGNSTATLMRIEGAAPPDDVVRVYTHGVSRDFFTAIGVPLVRGRGFDSRDTTQSPPSIIISDSMARRYWPNQDPIGKRLSRRRDPAGNPVWLQVVGVAGDVKYRTLIRDQNKDPDMYFSLSQQPSRELDIAMRVAGDPWSLVAAARARVQSLDANLPIFDVATMKQRLDGQTSSARVSALLLGVFAGLAMVLAIVGIYGVISHSVSERTHEIGIRMALGACRRDIQRMVVGEGMALVGAGLILGLAGAFAATRILAAQLYSVSATDPATFATVSLGLIGVALGGCFLPARRATRVDPMVVLHDE